MQCRLCGTLLTKKLGINSKMIHEQEYINEIAEFIPIRLSLPWSEVHTEAMQRTTASHDEITNTLFAEEERVVDHAIALDAGMGKMKKITLSNGDYGFRWRRKTS
jgi:hypothetical protein